MKIMDNLSFWAIRASSSKNLLDLLFNAIFTIFKKNCAIISNFIARTISPLGL